MSAQSWVGFNPSHLQLSARSDINYEMPGVMGHTLVRRAAEGSECLGKLQTIRCCPTLRHHQDVCSSIIRMMRYHLMQQQVYQVF